MNDPLYSEKERNVFAFNDGEKGLYGDPLALERRLRIACGGDPHKIAKRMNELIAAEWNDASDMEYYRLQEKLVSAVRQAFGMQPFDPQSGKGARDADCLKLWDDFWQWRDQKKTIPPSNNSLTLPQFTALRDSQPVAR